MRKTFFAAFIILSMMFGVQNAGAATHTEETYTFLQEIGATDAEIENQEHLVTNRQHSLIRDNYDSLKDIGSSDSDIVRQLHLLGRTPANIVKNYGFLKDIGSSDPVIVRQLHLLGRTPADIEKNYDFLKDIGSSDQDIVRQLHLLGRTTANMEDNYDFLKGIGITDSEIVNQVYLLGRMQEKLEDKYGEEPEETTIQSMIDEADEGETVIVPEGTYVENLVIDKPIELIGEDVILEGKIEINDDTTISAFTFDSDSGPILKINTGTVNISNNVFLANGNDAIDIVERFNDLFFINNNEFHDYDNAIILRGESIFEVKDNSFGEGDVAVMIYAPLQTLNDESTEEGIVESIREMNENVFDDNPLKVVVEDSNP